MKKRILFLLVFIWLVVIFIFSAQNGDQSKSLTIGGIDKVIGSSSSSSLKEGKKETVIQKLMTPVRKSAHFIEYCILGVLVSLLLMQTKLPISKVILFSILFCTLYAASDEIHQMFVRGRTAKVLDVCIDGAGSAAGTMIVYMLRRKKRVKNGTYNR